MTAHDEATLPGQVAVITGGASGIGRAIGQRFAAAGMRVVLADIEQEALDSTVEAWPGDSADVLGVQCDVADIDSMEQLRDATISRFGAVDVVCLNAGVAPNGPMLETPPQVWDWVFDVNIRGVVNGILAFGPALVDRGSGHIVCTASAAGLTDTPSVGPYGASKHAVVGIAAALRGELAPAGVGVSVLCPGLIDTKIFESERNRPRGMADPSAGNPTSTVLREILATGGSPPAQVADYVLRAVLDNQFFVFPTTDFDVGIEGRIAAVRQGLEWRNEVSPTFAGRDR